MRNHEVQGAWVAVRCGVREDAFTAVQPRRVAEAARDCEVHLRQRCSHTQSFAGAKASEGSDLALGTGLIATGRCVHEFYQTSMTK